MPLRPTRPTFSSDPILNDAFLTSVRGPMSIVRDETESMDLPNGVPMALTAAGNGLPGVAA